MYVCNNLTSLFSLWLLGIKQIQESEHGVLKFKNTNLFWLLESTDLILSDCLMIFTTDKALKLRHWVRGDWVGQGRQGGSGETGLVRGNGWVRGDKVGQRRLGWSEEMDGSGETGWVRGDRMGQGRQGGSRETEWVRGDRVG